MKRFKYSINLYSNQPKRNYNMSLLKTKISNLQENHLSTFSTDTTSKLNVLGHNGHPLRVNGAQVGVLEQTHQVSLRSLLKSKNRMALEPQISLDINNYIKISIKVREKYWSIFWLRLKLP